MIYREIKEKINKWIKYDNDALLVTGARQIGKTYLIRQCLEDSDYNFVEFNFIENSELIELFTKANSTKDLLTRLSLASDKPLVKNKTIIFFDEIQEIEDIVTRIKFLVEDGTYKYILSGSLLGVELKGLRSAPVGYLEILNMYPMSFKEFILSLDVNINIVKELEDCFNNTRPVDDYIHNRLIDLFYLYLIVGGMPEAVNTYIESNNLQDVASVHKKIKDLYRVDFVRYEEKYKLELKEVFDSLPGQLNQENKRFKLNEIKDNATYEELKSSFIWLKDAGVALPVYNVSEPKLPLNINEKRSLFKLFMSDVGLLTSFYSNSVKMQILNKDKSINNGALFENVVAQELVCNGINAYYFNSKKQGELDFVIELDGKVLPIEVKSGKDYKKHSALCNVLSNKDYDIEHGYILSNNNVSIKDRRIYLPIYMIMFIKEKDLLDTKYTIDISGLK